MRQTVALFGEAEKGKLTTLISITSLIQLNERLGHPPKESYGLFFAIQFLLYEYELIYVRVKEEGFSTKEYLKGIQLLLSKKQVIKLAGICLPGVGDAHILDATAPICGAHQCSIVTTEQDLYDYLTSL